MQSIMETLFDAVYLITVITLGIIMITKSKEKNINYLELWLSYLAAVMPFI